MKTSIAGCARMMELIILSWMFLIVAVILLIAAVPQTGWAPVAHFVLLWLGLPVALWGAGGVLSGLAALWGNPLFTQARRQGRGTDHVLAALALTLVSMLTACTFTALQAWVEPRLAWPMTLAIVGTLTTFLAAERGIRYVWSGPRGRDELSILPFRPGERAAGYMLAAAWPLVQAHLVMLPAILGAGLALGLAGPTCIAWMASLLCTFCGAVAGLASALTTRHVDQARCLASLLAAVFLTAAPTLWLLGLVTPFSPAGMLVAPPLAGVLSTMGAPGLHVLLAFGVGAVALTAGCGWLHRRCALL